MVAIKSFNFCKSNKKIDMKRNILTKFVAVLFCTCVIACFNSCNDDIDGCGLTVIVTDPAANGARVSGATIKIGKDAGTVRREGVSDNNGEAHFIFDHEAIFDINVSYGSAPYEKTGLSTVRLQEGKVVKKEVLIQ